MTQDSPARRRMTPDERRRHILTAAIDLLQTESIDAVTVDSVARQAGVSPGLVFHYFGTQRRLRRELAQAAAWDLVEQITPDPALSPAEQLHNGITAFVAKVALQPGMYRAVASTANPGLRGLREALRSVIAGWVAAGIEDLGVSRTPRITITIAGWVAFVEQVLLDWVAKPQLSQDEIVVICEHACYLLMEAAVADPECWAKIEQALQSPAASPNPHELLG
jgi:AcrR family transcriptional regulator